MCTESTNMASLSILPPAGWLLPLRLQLQVVPHQNDLVGIPSRYPARQPTVGSLLGWWSSVCYVPYEIGVCPSTLTAKTLPHLGQIISPNA